MALFGRGRKNLDQVPEEIQEYYDAEERDRTGVAWLLAFATLVVTILLAAGIFFAGRWTYHKLAGNDKNKTSQTAQKENENQQEAQTGDSSQQSQAEKNAAAERKAADEQKAREEQQQKDRRQAAEQQALSAGTGASSGNIPDTGPGGTIAVFFVVSIAGYLLHRLYSVRKPLA